MFITLNSCSENKISDIKSSTDYYFLKSNSDNDLFIFLTGYNQNFYEVIQTNSTLLNQLKSKDYSVLFINSSNTLLYDSLELDNIYKQVIEILQNKFPKSIHIGGFSMGGFGAAKLLLKFQKENQKGNSLILVDSPLDLNRFTKSIVNQITNTEKISREEAKYIYNLIKSKAVSSSISIDSLCRRETVVSAENALGVKDFLLTKTKIFAFTNLSLGWQFLNRGRSLYDMHALDISMFLSNQKKRGNSNIFLCIEKTENTNPHSWSNLNVDSLLKWVSYVR
ncbi:alpha/beta hydrolase [Sediminibacterium sp.]|jgi:hypothetical protein|uniref:alpha/beta hydrolase n=1 Tax=Sediminibacterium sp. TaxID=1917865 RepID=UPI00272D35CC|nr:alpha/beta hydrolase [Sediminibacterium sp.]MDP2420824.1 alpha/beta hydrolase [Sediminibacterium sp.]